MATAAALHLLYRPGRAEAHGHLDDAKVVETQQAEKSKENVYHRAAWHEAPKTQNWNRVRRDMPLRNSSQHSPCCLPAYGRRLGSGRHRHKAIGGPEDSKSPDIYDLRAAPSWPDHAAEKPSSARRRSAYHGPTSRLPAHGGHCLKASARPVTQAHRLYSSMPFPATLSRG